MSDFKAEMDQIRFLLRGGEERGRKGEGREEERKGGEEKGRGGEEREAEGRGGEGRASHSAYPHFISWRCL